MTTVRRQPGEVNLRAICTHPKFMNQLVRVRQLRDGDAIIWIEKGYWKPIFRDRQTIGEVLRAKRDPPTDHDDLAPTRFTHWFRCSRNYLKLIAENDTSRKNTAGNQ